MDMTGRYRKSLPRIWLMTDERIDDAALLRAAARLPRGRAGIIFRHYRTASRARRALFDRLCAVARRRRIVLILAGDARQAVAWGADGWHGRGTGRAARSLLHSAPAHDRREIVAATQNGADLMFLSPLFPTRSHPGAPHLGRARFAALARSACVPVMALGGVKAHHARMLRGIGAAGWAAIDGLSGDRIAQG